jgi:hypothetical protein
MKTSLIVKINFLVLGLGLTLYLILAFQKQGLPEGLRVALGIGGPADNSLSVNDQTAELRQWNWCATRVTGIESLGRWGISQQKRKWIRSGELAGELDFIAVEKWLAQFCSVLVTPVKALVDEAFTESLRIQFVNGATDEVRRHPNGTYFWKGQTFTSPEFDAALEAISKLAAK